MLIDGRPIREYSLETLRRHIGFVPQETFLFSATIRENIAFGVEDATDEQMQRRPRSPASPPDVEGFPEKYETMVGERGLTLSGGQKQRTAIARAVIRNPRILVLDDALASVDTHTEDQILNDLREVMQGRTTIFISHRVSTVRNADRIAVLHHGQIVEYGTHDELLALNGYYTSPARQTTVGRGTGNRLKSLWALDIASNRCYYVHVHEIPMRTTIALDDELVRQAENYSGIKVKTSLVREALTRLVRNEAARRMAVSEGAIHEAEAQPRRRGKKCFSSILRSGLTTCENPKRS